MHIMMVIPVESRTLDPPLIVLELTVALSECPVKDGCCRDFHVSDYWRLAFAQFDCTALNWYALRSLWLVGSERNRRPSVKLELDRGTTN